MREYYHHNDYGFHSYALVQKVAREVDSRLHALTYLS
jgi:hypothetical protein